MNLHAYAKLNKDKRGKRLIAAYKHANGDAQAIGLAYFQLVNAPDEDARRRALAKFYHEPGQTEEEWLEEHYPETSEGGT
jgi:hypothetical protein